MLQSKIQDNAISFDLDLSSFFPLAYEGQCGSAMIDLFNRIDYTDMNQIIGRTLAGLIPKHYEQVWNYYSFCKRTPNSDIEECIASISKDKYFPLRFYDFGAMGSRSTEITKTFNSCIDGNANYVPQISEVCIIDSSLDIIKTTLDDYDSDILDISCAQLADFTKVRIPPLYEEANMFQQQATPYGDLISNYDCMEYATCRCNLEKRIFALLGRTINNFDNPGQYLADIFCKNMSPLDILVVEGRSLKDSQECVDEKYSNSLELMKNHARINLGIGEEYTNGGSSVRIENRKRIIYAYLTLEKDFTDQEGLFSDKGKNYESGTNILLAYNKPLGLHSFIKETAKNGLRLLESQVVGNDTLFYFKKNNQLPPFYASCFAQSAIGKIKIMENN